MATNTLKKDIDWAINQLIDHMLVCVRRIQDSSTKYGIGELGGLFDNEEEVSWVEVKQSKEASDVVIQAAIDYTLDE